jgi:hypothetical protein
MPDLSFEVKGAEAVPYAAAPTINLQLRITNAVSDEAVQSVMLRCQIQIETTRRQYSTDEQARLFDLYGEPERWGQTLRSLHWTHAGIAVRPFTGSMTADLPVECTFDFNVATTKYFDGLDGGDIPLCLLFSGTVFYKDSEGSLQIAQISWEKEANYRLPLSVWKEMMGLYYPNSAWLNIRKDVFDKLNEYKMRHSITSWEQALESLLPVGEEMVKSSSNGGKA